MSDAGKEKTGSWRMAKRVLGEDEAKVLAAFTPSAPSHILARPNL
jgi:hypothetical protein